MPSRCLVWSYHWRGLGSPGELLSGQRLRDLYPRRNSFLATGATAPPNANLQPMGDPCYRLLLVINKCDRDARGISSNPKHSIHYVGQVRNLPTRSGVITLPGLRIARIHDECWEIIKKIIQHPPS